MNDQNRDDATFTANRDRGALGIFAKRPRPGQVKSRLARETSPEWAARVAMASLRDTLQRLRVLDFARVLAYSPRDETDFFASLVQGDYDLVPQADGDLGQRMASFFATQMQQGSGRVVLVGSDSPTIPVEFVEQAFHQLEQYDVVLGPCTDGGYYLLGCTGRVPPIFDGIAWGSHRVLLETMARLQYGDWRVAVLPPWYDVDTLDDWWVLRGHLAALRQAGIDPQVPHTEAIPDPC